MLYYRLSKRREGRVHRHGVTSEDLNFEQRRCEGSSDIVNCIMMFFLRLIYDVSAYL